VGPEIPALHERPSVAHEPDPRANVEALSGVDQRVQELRLKSEEEVSLVLRVRVDPARATLLTEGDLRARAIEDAARGLGAALVGDADGDLPDRVVSLVLGRRASAIARLGEAHARVLVLLAAERRLHQRHAALIEKGGGDRPHVFAARLAERA